MSHWKGGWHKLAITNYLGKADLVINMALTTSMQTLTTHQDRLRRHNPALTQNN